jgi:glycosyltransferase involved in cell wall biosynthesis
MYPDMAVGGAIVEPGLLARVWERLNRWALRRAACVIVLGEDMKNRILSKGIDASKIEIVRDGVEISSNSAAPTVDMDVVRKIRGEFQFVLVHAGNIGFYGAWDTLLSAAKELTTDGVGFIFVGEGAQRDALAVQAAGISSVRFLPFFPGSKVPSVLAAADAHLITIKRGLEGVVVPSKMYGILDAGKPIVAVAPMETDVASYGVKQGFGVAVDPDQPAELAAVIRTLVADSNRLKQMGTAAKEAAHGYDRTSELQKFLRIVGQMRARGKN